jgi:transglutaminase-like putative cysteine protease
LAFYHYVDAHCRYMRDPRTIEYVRAPHVVAKQLLDGERPQLDCDDLTALLCGLLAITGSRCRAATLAFQNLFYQGERQFSHVLAQAWEPRTGAWVTLDPVAGPRTRQMLQCAVAVKFWPIV